MSADIVAVPRDPNPYQELLYSRMRAAGHRVTYAGELTPSRSLNLLLMPIQLALLRLSGYRILHLHWTFSFTFPGSERRRCLAALSRWWFQLILMLARVTGLQVVWTAHNLLPHNPVFDDDRRARRFLVAHADLVIAHTAATLEAVSSQFGPLAAGAVIAHGPIEPPGLAATPPLSGAQPRSVLFFGAIERYKGVEDLLAACDGLSSDIRIHIAGRCADPDLAGELERRARTLPGVTVALGYVAEEAIAALFAAADAVIFPYRTVTTSGSVTLAAVAGRPIVIPDLPGFAEIPAAAAIRHPAGVDGIRAGLEEIAHTDTVGLRQKGAAAREMAAAISWEAIAEQTSRALDQILS